MNSAGLRPWKPRPGEWDRSAAAHLLRRVGFGAPPDELERALAEGPEATLARSFEDRGDPELRASVRSLLATGKIELLQAWWMALILEGGAPLRERVALLWHGRFATSHDKVDDVRLMHGQNELFRAQGLGDFRALLHGVARDPAMLVWLDGNTNRRGHPNENFAREVMELFALGIGCYSEEDVREAARAFTGWGTEGRAFVFREEHHDPGPKTLFGRAGNWDGDDAIDIVLAQPACSRHIARTLLEAFVAPRPEPEWIEETAALLVSSAWNVARTLEILLSSELFYSSRARRSRIAGPVELVAVAARSLGARIAPGVAARLAGEMGQSLFRPPSVKGWDGGRAWINSGRWIARHNALVQLVEAHRGGADEPRRASGQSGSRNELVESVVRALVPEVQAERLSRVLAAAALQVRELDAARKLVTAAVLTAPEYQLF